MTCPVIIRLHFHPVDRPGIIQGQLSGTPTIFQCVNQAELNPVIRPVMSRDGPVLIMFPNYSVTIALLN